MKISDVHTIFAKEVLILIISRITADITAGESVSVSPDTRCDAKCVFLFSGSPCINDTGAVLLIYENTKSTAAIANIMIMGTLISVERYISEYMKRRSWRY